MDITGARWSTDGAEAILQLRVIHRQRRLGRLLGMAPSSNSTGRTYHNHRNCYQLAA